MLTIAILAETAITSPQTVGAGAALLVIGWLINSGYTVVVTKRRNGKKDSSDAGNTGEISRKCPVHDNFSELINERIETLRADVKDVREAVRDGQKATADSLNTIHRRIDEFFKKQ